MKILTIVGARPQFVKAAVVSREIRKPEYGITELIVHTGQHFDDKMSKVFFDEMEIPVPDYNLNINSLSHGAMTGRMMEGIEKIATETQPDVIMVYGDTNSTLAGALVGSKLHIPIAHVEAGLRSFAMQMPEEINRILTDRISSLLLCPTDSAINNLKNEGFDQFECKVIKCGDVMQDAALFYSAKSKSSPLVPENEYVLVTVHRAENTDNPDRLHGIINALNQISEEIDVVLPIHPRTRKILNANKLQTSFNLIDPVGYLDMVNLVKSCNMVLTDSGGLQKEAFFFGKHCVTMRDQTEWVELVDHGFNLVAGAKETSILDAWNQLRTKKSDFSIDLYGGGKASKVIAESLLAYLK